ncbi:hypothetical protein HII28_02915 [Planctomonas sp. JC2975]|uniref:hypothetical protein n=1 Tax=Planctomonas sp. JC2975 TaxID=2729626 RepID=UPI0014766484|nr:hypothetical protein [Planctomonas sp. JC2975]NNC10834.1 hypothetical protein [Planctomonas sp. JC2975]
MSTATLHYREPSFAERTAVRLGALMVEWGNASAQRREDRAEHVARIQARYDEDSARRTQVWGRMMP